ncbi:winged helix-turn-helix transcriptional regulator [Candidatus Saccharibacteria bacterium]|nr:winged helix-turn-helix transcriptional regulator [Candidatus Saccharibacteria bacterium]
MNKGDVMPLDKLFGSKTRAKLLALFFDNPEKSYYVREITRVIEEQINSVRRELNNLSSLGLVKTENYENKVYYSANMKHPFARPMTEIFARSSSSAAAAAEGRTSAKQTASVWEEYVRPVANLISGLIVTNRIPGQDGLDLLIIGDDRTHKLTKWAEVVEKRQGKPLNYAIMSRDDYIYRKSVRDKFLGEVLALQISEKYDPERIL